MRMPSTMTPHPCADGRFESKPRKKQAPQSVKTAGPASFVRLPECPRYGSSFQLHGQSLVDEVVANMDHRIPDRRIPGRICT